MSSPVARLLIVDDVPANRDLLRRRFAPLGFEISEADDGMPALALIAREEFDVVLLDIVMPGIDGIETLKRIRASYSPAMLPVIMVTARADATDVVEALKLGANDYIVKPINFPVALARVEAQIARKQAERALRHANDQLARNVRELVEMNERLAREIAGRERSEARIQYLAQHDDLTGLTNRVRFREQLFHALSRIDPQTGSLALLCVGLDQFKAINDTVGHAIGDALLRAVAQRLRGCVRDSDTLARLGGDEFAIIPGSVNRPEEAGAIAQRIIEALAKPYKIQGREVIVSCSIGIAMGPNDGTDADLLLTSAGMALQRAKVDGRATSRFFEPQMNRRAQLRRRLESDLRNALPAGELEVFYQPLFDLKLGAITGCEALIRWRHPERGLVSPGEFIPLAEELGLIVPFGEWVLRQACADAAAWPRDIKVAVNLSAIQFRRGNLFNSVVTALAASGLKPHRLELEITESVLLKDDDRTVSILHELRNLGVRISMDDFGTGYSSLSYLRSFPFDKIKIDQSFIRNLSDDNGSLAIVRAITDLAGGLGMATTAEGVETEGQLEQVRKLGCTEVQGYLFSRPVPCKDLLPLLSPCDSVEQKVA